MIRKYLMASAAILAVTGSSFAADLPSRRAPPVYVPPVPVFTWTGIYVGGQIGYGFDRDSYYASNVFAGGAYRPTGVVGGAHVGYNLSSQGLFGNLLGAGGVIGIEGDVDGTSLSRSQAVFPTSTLNIGTRIPIEGSIRGRVGFAVDRALFYATGGAAFASLRNNYFSNTFGAFPTVGHTRVGYTVGGGVEYAITNNWSVRAEYRYTDYGAYNDFTGPLGATPIRNHITDNRIQVGFSYKFDTFAPPAAVVAKY